MTLVTLFFVCDILCWGYIFYLAIFGSVDGNNCKDLYWMVLSVFGIFNLIIWSIIFYNYQTIREYFSRFLLCFPFRKMSEIKVQSYFKEKKEQVKFIIYSFFLVFLLNFTSDVLIAVGFFFANRHNDFFFTCDQSQQRYVLLLPFPWIDGV